MVRRAIHRFIPRSLQDPAGLAGRIARSGSADAHFAALTAALGLLATPLDLLLQVREKRLYERASAPQRPIVFVCGAPRSGTTLVAQMLIRHLPVSYISNLSTVFPRSPIAASQLFRARLSNERVLPRSYYGRTAHFWGPNDALQIWDRWMGVDRASPPGELSEASRAAMRQFFGALVSHFRRPVLNKNNSLNVVAHLVAETLETARFVCVTRDPLYLAQSLLKAREDIHGSREHPYGVPAPVEFALAERDPFREVCRQALFHNDLAGTQQERLGPDRVLAVSYERFCGDPQRLITEVADRWLGGAAPRSDGADQIESLRAANRRKLPEPEFERLAATLRSVSADPLS